MRLMKPKNKASAKKNAPSIVIDQVSVDISMGVVEAVTVQFVVYGNAARNVSLPPPDDSHDHTSSALWLRTMTIVFKSGMHVHWVGIRLSGNLVERDTRGPLAL